MKQCIQCKNFKSFDEFYTRKDSTKYQNKCKLCMDENYKNYYNKNKEKILHQQQTESKEKRRNYELKRKYNISLKEYNSIIESQNYKCIICNNNLNEITPHLDHCHKTNKIRGILCRHCNQGIGQFKDNPQLLIKAANYLMV